MEIGQVLSPSAHDKLFTALQTIGFSNKEVRVYLALLQLGQATATRIARLAAINRTTAYDILATLASKHLVTALGKEPKQEYRAESPDHLVVYQKERLKQGVGYLAIVEELVPQLKSFHMVTDRPVVRFYEGEKGLRYVYEDTLTAHETIRAYASVEDTNAGLPGYFPKYYKRRTAAGIGIRAIFPHTKEASERSAFDKIEKRESVHVPREKYAFSPEINIYDNKVMIASWKEKLGITIESREISDAMKKIFELAWAEANRLDKEINPNQKKSPRTCGRRGLRAEGAG